MTLRRPLGPRCPACDSPVGNRHAATCHLLRLGGHRRHPLPYVTNHDTQTLACGCSALLVRQHGGWGHRVDHSEPDTKRPPVFSRTEIVIGAALLLLAAVNAYVATRSYEPRDTIVAAATATVITLGVTAAALLRADLAPADWAGRRTYLAGEPGRFVRCAHCAGDGIVFAEAYPALNDVGHPPTTAPGTY